ncbi:hypothetical protein AJ87_48725 [Rhizobium yanglingense]|nr:hypothetical protein AJ87_48725 [Rhizobium yanglingense]
MKQQYSRHIPKGHETIARRIIAHFLPYLISSVRPSVFIESVEGTIDLAEYLKEKEVKLGHLDLIIDTETTLHLDHNLLEKSVVEGKAAHRIYLAAHGRVVADFDIGLALGLTTYIDRTGVSYDMPECFQETSSTRA